MNPPLPGALLPFPPHPLKRCPPSGKPSPGVSQRLAPPPGHAASPELSPAPAPPGEPTPAPRARAPPPHRCCRPAARRRGLGRAGPWLPLLPAPAPSAGGRERREGGGYTGRNPGAAQAHSVHVALPGPGTLRQWAGPERPRGLALKGDAAQQPQGPAC